jgi:Spy/CpxP family protein refolding chaperone
MNKRFQALIGGAALASLLFAPLMISANAQTNSPGTATPKPRMHHWFGGAPLISIALKHQTDLNLSADQVANLEKIRSNFQAQATPIAQQLRDIEKQIRTLEQQSPANLVQIKALIQQTEPLRSELRYLRTEALENGKSVLNTQQQDQLKTILASLRQHFRKPQPQQPQAS